MWNDGLSCHATVCFGRRVEQSRDAGPPILEFLLLLLPENQNRTTVTPLIFKIGHPYFVPEEMKLLDRSRPYTQTMEQREREYRSQRAQLFRYLNNARQPKGEPIFPSGHRRHQQYWDLMVLNRVEYKVCRCGDASPIIDRAQGGRCCTCTRRSLYRTAI